MFKKTHCILLFIFLASCADTWDGVKRGLTGAKKDSADEFLVKKKDPLILPPDFENLPTPDEREVILKNLRYSKILWKAMKMKLRQEQHLWNLLY